nr:hypothetical protein [Tanacetum cinerariifolium]
MATNDKESSAASTNNCPPMLEESDFESWKIRIERKMNQTSWNADPLAYMAQETQSTSSPSQYVPPPPHGFQKQFPPANNQLKTSTNPMTQATNQAGQITTESVQQRASDAEAEDFLADVEYTVSYAEPLAITTTTSFEVTHENAYNSDVDEGPYAAAAFMANLKQTGLSTRDGNNNDTDFHAEVQTYDNYFFDNLNHQVSQEMHQGEQLDSDVDSVIDDHDNTTPYHQYQLNNKVESIPTHVSSVLPGGISVITILDDLRSQLAGHIKVNEEQSFANDSLKAELERYKTQVQNLEQTLYLGDVIVDPVHTPFRVYDSEETLVQVEVSRTKMLEKMKDPLCKMSSKPVNYAKLNSLYDTFVPQKQLSREQVYWLPANEVASYNSNQSKPVTDFVRTRPAKSQVNTKLKMLKACFLKFDKVVKD